HEQCLIGRHDSGNFGFALVIGPAGDLAFRIGSVVIATGKPLRSRQWYRAEARYDAESSSISVTQTPLQSFARDDSAASASGSARMLPCPSVWPLFIGRGYNGKIEAPRITDAKGVVASWDFAEGIGTTQVTDRSLNALHGETVNLPARGMIG